MTEMEAVETKEDQDLLVPRNEYLKAGIHVGTKFKTKYMSDFIYETRADGLSVMNVQKINDRIKIAAKFLSRFNPEDIIVVARREHAWRAIKKFGKAMGCTIFAGRYPPGIMTNPNLKNYIEPKVLIVTDAKVDKNAVFDAIKIGIPVIALSDTNNEANFVDLVLPCNNKGKKSIALVYWILAREYMKIKGLIKSDDEFKEKLEDFVGE